MKNAKSAVIVNLFCRGKVIRIPIRKNLVFAYKRELVNFKKRFSTDIVSWLYSCAELETTEDDIRASFRIKKFPKLGSKLGFAWLIQEKLGQGTVRQTRDIDNFTRAVIEQCLKNTPCIRLLENDICLNCPKMLGEIKIILRHYAVG